ncbi:hypothetical protein HB815_06435 [Listeria booriae]|nr:hypothetical protein [Listeria booriae]MBC1210559.1 hypothetical protein [Listeria booriae]
MAFFTFLMPFLMLLLTFLAAFLAFFFSFLSHFGMLPLGSPNEVGLLMP